jgi:predicted nucleotidyltransferase
MTRDDILATIAKHEGALRRLHVSELALFGSYVRGEERPDSDIDFVVELSEKTFDAYMDLKEFLENLFEKPIDLVMKSAIKPRLRDRILGEAVRAA